MPSGVKRMQSPAFQNQVQLFTIFGSNPMRCKPIPTDPNYLLSVMRLTGLPPGWIPQAPTSVPAILAHNILLHKNLCKTKGEQQ